METEPGRVSSERRNRTLKEGLGCKKARRVPFHLVRNSGGPGGGASPDRTKEKKREWSLNGKKGGKEGGEDIKRKNVFVRGGKFLRQKSLSKGKSTVTAKGPTDALERRKRPGRRVGPA